jgi:DNA transformation protein and related proteins
MRDTSFHDYVVHDVLGGLSGISSKMMFGGWGIYKEETIFGIIAESSLYFKVGETNKDDYKKLGSKPFVYEGAGKPVTMSYWEVPAEILENRELLSEWVDRSVEVSAVSRKGTLKKIRKPRE